ncbi:hypothetical protein [Vibrio chagasii]|uniref:hypothetical protein n=1 Tax=Vibrio chagasii TaxID=170679 RepID=UPI0016409832|nr:hypothetical protein [Vibrio chagasii]
MTNVLIPLLSLTSAMLATVCTIPVRISVIAIARFGLFRSLDPAVFLSSYFYSK